MEKYTGIRRVSGRGLSLHSPPGLPGMLSKGGISRLTSVLKRDKVEASGSKPILEPFRRNVEFVEKPRSVVMALIIFCYVTYISFSDLGFNDEADPSSLIQNAMITLFVTNGVYSVLNLRDSQYTLRPHPAFWRLVHGCCLFYFHIVLLLTVLPPTQGKWLVRSIFPNKHMASRPVPTGTDGVADAVVGEGDKSEEKNDTLGNWHLNCKITFATLWKQLTSIWFVAHIIGW